MGKTLQSERDIQDPDLPAGKQDRQHRRNAGESGCGNCSIPFDDNVDTLYASADATRLHQIIRMAVQSSTLTEVDLYELRLLLPRILPQEQEDEEAAPASAASEKEDDWNEWSERESQRYRQRRRLLEEQHELLHMLQTLQHQHKEEHRPVLLHHRGHGHQR